MHHHSRWSERTKEDSLERSRLYGFGSNGSGQLGIGHTNDVSSPQVVLEELGVATAGATSIAAGGNHTIVVLGNGKVATAGDNHDGRCFTTNNESTPYMTEVTVPSRDLTLDECFTGKQMAATWSATVLIDGHGSVHVSGSGSVGELGVGEGKQTTTQPMKLSGFPPPNTHVVKLAAGMGHVVAVLSNGEVWGWGRGRKGQLGKPAEIVWRPRRIEGVGFFALDAVCGKDFSAIVGHPSTGELLILGLDGNDRFGVVEHAPKTVVHWKQVAASWGSIYVLLESGVLLGWGRDDHGQLPPPNLPALTMIAAGSEHCLGITKSGKVLAWGWGEHGNCSLPIDPHSDVKGRWNMIRLSSPALKVFAGCATSFVVTDEKHDKETSGSSQSNIP